MRFPSAVSAVQPSPPLSIVPVSCGIGLPAGTRHATGSHWDGRRAKRTTPIHEMRIGRETIPEKPNLGVRGDAKLPIKVFSSHFALLPEPPEFHPVVTTIPGRSSSGSVFPSQPALRSICRCTCGIREFPSNTGDLFFFVSRCKHERFRRFHCGRW